MSAAREIPFGTAGHFGGQMNPVLNAVIGRWVTNAIVTMQEGNPFNTLRLTTPHDLPETFGRTCTQHDAQVIRVGGTLLLLMASVTLIGPGLHYTDAYAWWRFDLGILSP